MIIYPSLSWVTLVGGSDGLLREEFVISERHNQAQDRGKGSTPEPGQEIPPQCGRLPHLRVGARRDERWRLGHRIILRSCLRRWSCCGHAVYQRQLRESVHKEPTHDQEGREQVTIERGGPEKPSRGPVSKSATARQNRRVRLCTDYRKQDTKRGGCATCTGHGTTEDLINEATLPAAQSDIDDCGNLDTVLAHVERLSATTSTRSWPSLPCRTQRTRCFPCRRGPR